MATIFTRIINGELPGTFVWRDDRAVAFMSINPMVRGHVLVVSVIEVDPWTAADSDLLAHLFEVCRIIGVAQETAFECERVGLMIAGHEVPHLHVHVVPTMSAAELSFAHAASHVDPAELEAAAEAIRAQLRAAGRPEVAAAAS